MYLKNKKELKDYLKNNGYHIIDTNVVLRSGKIGSSKSYTNKGIVFYDSENDCFKQIETKNNMNYELTKLKVYNTSSIYSCDVYSRTSNCFKSDKIKDFIYENSHLKSCKHLIDKYESDPRSVLNFLNEKEKTLLSNNIKTTNILDFIDVNENQELHYSSLMLNNLNNIKKYISYNTNIDDYGNMSTNGKHKTYMPKSPNLKYFLGQVLKQPSLVKSNDIKIGHIFMFLENVEKSTINEKAIFINKQNNDTYFLFKTSANSMSGFKFESNNTLSLVRDLNLRSLIPIEDRISLNITDIADIKQFPSLNDSGECVLKSIHELEYDLNDNVLNFDKMPENTAKSFLQAQSVDTLQKAKITNQEYLNIYKDAYNNNEVVIKINNKKLMISFLEKADINKEKEYSAIKINEDKYCLIDNDYNIASDFKLSKKDLNLITDRKNKAKLKI